MLNGIIKGVNRLFRRTSRAARKAAETRAGGRTGPLKMARAGRTGPSKDDDGGEDRSI